MLATKDMQRIETIKELAQRRDKVIQILNKYAMTIKKLDSELKQISKTSGGIFSMSFYSVHNATDGYNAKLKSDKKIVFELDSQLWETAINQSGVLNLLSNDIAENLKKEYTEKHLIFSEHEANERIDRLIENSGNLSHHTVFDVFNKLTGTAFYKSDNWNNRNKENRSHDEIKKSFRFNHFYDTSRVRSEDFNLFADIELACRLVNGLAKLPREKRLDSRMQEQMYYKSEELEWPVKFEEDYFNLTIFKRGTVKIDFTCNETLKFLNKWGADHKRISK